MCQSLHPQILIGQITNENCKHSPSPLKKKNVQCGVSGIDIVPMIVSDTLKHDLAVFTGVCTKY